MNAAIQEAKRKLPLSALMYRLGRGEHAKKSARCPFHEDQRNSFSVYKNGSGEFRFKCFAGCGEGDEITFLEKHYGISNKEAMKLFLEMAGVNGATATPRNATSTSTLDWPAW
jgi:DNA primase